MECRGTLTVKQKRAYIKEGGIRCPFCKSNDIEGQSFDFEADGVFQNVICLTCEKEWTDHYKLHCVEEYVDPWKEKVCNG